MKVSKKEKICNNVKRTIMNYIDEDVIVVIKVNQINLSYFQNQTN